MTSNEPDRVQALENENRRLRRAVDELSVLNELSREIGASHDSVEIMSRIVKRSIQAIRAEQGVVTLVDEDDREPMRTLVRTRSDSAGDSSFHFDEALLGWMMIHRRPLVINNPGGDERFKGVSWDEQIRNVVSAPLLARSRLIGAVTLYNKKAADGFSEEDLRLLAIIGTQSAQIVENARLYEEERALLRMREELHLAAEIQRKLLPDESPEIPGYQLAGRSIPAQSVGGDYFDYVVIDSRRVAACVADVSGKGLPASLMMATVQATLRAQSLMHESASSCLTATNGLLRRSMRRGTFVTIVYGILDVEAHSIKLANAGHNRPIAVRADGTLEQIDGAGFVAGVVEDIDPPEQLIQLAPGDALFLYSDGVTEAMNERREEFGEDRLRRVLEQSRHHSAAEIVERVLDAVTSFVGGADPHDDITMSVIKRTAPARLNHSSSPDQVND